MPTLATLGSLRQKPHVSETEQEPPTRAALEERIGHRFREVELLDEALTHPSWANVAVQRGESGRDNQRLEFLGDAVLDLLVGERLYLADPKAPPGTLTQRRIALVGLPRLARLGVELHLGSLLKVGPGEARAGVSDQPSTLADTFEALLGAVYLDAGLAAAGTVIDRLLGPELEQLREPANLKSHKALLQERTQGESAFTPRYRLLSAAPDFEVEVTFGPKLTATGRGPTRRGAEEQAARAALESLPTASLAKRRPRKNRHPAPTPEERR